MTPTREEFEVVAEWLGVSLLWMRGQQVPYVQMPLGRAKWQPHLPGIDSYRLMVAIECDINWCAEAPMLNVTAWGKDGDRISSDEIEFDETIDSRSQALADAVWQCAVKVAMEAKR
jgi:hypothetical protein